MLKKVSAYVEKWQMLKKEDRVMIGVSGGADSVCLLFVLLELQKQLELELTAVHVHHGLRGAEADRDEAFVKELCQKQGVELRVQHFDVKKRAEEEKISLEEAVECNTECSFVCAEFSNVIKSNHIIPMNNFCVVCACIFFIDNKHSVTVLS